MKQFRLIFSTVKLLSFFSVLSLAFLLLNATGCNSTQRKYLERQTQATDEAIAKSQALQELNNVCIGVKLPDGFTFVSKGGLDDQKLSLSYHYYSDTPFDESRKTFEKYFSEKGWSEDDLSHRYPKQLDFKNSEYRIAIYYGGMGNLSNYSVYCEKLQH